MMASRYSFGQSSSLAGFTRAVGALRVGIAPHLAARLDQHLDQRRKMRRRRSAIDQQRLGRAAHAGAPHLGVEHDGLGHVEIGRLMHIDVADAFEMREHRHARFFLHARDEILAAARHDHVDGAAKAAEHEADRRAIDRRHELDRGLRQTQPRPGPRSAHWQMTSEVRKLSEPLRRITALPDLRQSAAGVGRHVRPRLVDDADHAERHAHAGNLQAVRPRPRAPSPRRPDRQAPRCRASLAPSPPRALRPAQPVEEGLVAALAARGLEILAVGFEDLPGCSLDARSPSASSAAFFCFGRGKRKRRAPPRARGGPYRASSARCLLAAVRPEHDIMFLNSSAAAPCRRGGSAPGRPR